MILISTHKISKSYSGRQLFSDISLGIHSKEKVALVGPNGAGKSTLLRILQGLETPDDGDVSRKKGLKVGFLEQTPQFAKGATILSTVLEKTQADGDSVLEAQKIITKLQLSNWPEDFPVEQLSGGWKKRVALARELLSEPELLLMDEPTNHLDVQSILWLEEFVARTDAAILMVTHDRLFLQRTAQRIMDLDPRLPDGLLSIEGTYSDYLEARDLLIDAQKRHEQVERNRLRRETEWLHRGSIARQTKQSARQVAALELKETVSDLAQRNRNESVGLEFKANEKAPKKLLWTHDLTKSFGEKKLVTQLNLQIHRSTRIALLGENGSGKSTLIRLLLGLETPDGGTVERAENIKISHFEQDRQSLNPNESIMTNVCPKGDHVFFQGRFVHVRSYLSRFLFHGIKVDQPVGNLSGGEQARVRLAQIMLEPAQLLILDEPTNDLDQDTLRVLESALQEFDGAVILVTHDRYFMDAVANEILAFPSDGSGQLEKFASYFQWEDWQKKSSKSKQSKDLGNVKQSEAASAPKNAAAVKLSNRERFELESMERTVLDLETRIESLTVESQDPEIARDHQKLNSLLKELSGLQSQAEKLYERWNELEKKKNPQG